MSDKGNKKIWGKIHVVARTLVRTVLSPMKEDGQFLTTEFKIASLIGCNQHDLFHKVLSRFKEEGLTWSAKNKHLLDPFLLTIVSASFVQLLLEEFDSVPVATTVIRITHATSSETEVQQQEDQRQVIEAKYPGWFANSCKFMIEYGKKFGPITEESLNQLISDIKEIIISFKPVEKWEKKNETPTPFVADIGTIVPMNCHWYYSQFKWCSGTNDSGNFCCPRSHGISLGVCLGKGQYGSVYHCKFEALHETSEQNAMTASGKTFVEGAAKVFSLAVDSEAHTNFMNELHMLSKLGTHPNTLTLLASSIESPNYVVVTELMVTSLYHFLYEEDNLELVNKKTQPYLMNIISQIHEGIYHTHESGIIHRDIKSYDPVEVVVSDFGTATFLPYGETISNSKFMVGSPVYMAPEVARLEPYSLDADTYSFAILAAEILTGKEPYHDEIAKYGNDYQNIHALVLSSQLRPSLPASCPASLEQLLRRCWVDKSVSVDTERPPHPEIRNILSSLSIYEPSS